jgi:hypothetical protein
MSLKIVPKDACDSYIYSESRVCQVHLRKSTSERKGKNRERNSDAAIGHIFELLIVFIIASRNYVFILSLTRQHKICG